MYFRRMLSLAENVFEFENLPKYIDVAFLNKTLLRQGAIAFFKDEVMGLIALPFAFVGKVDVYGRPTTIQVYGQNNYSRILKDGEYVIMYDNNGRYPLYLDICQMAERLALCIRTEDINMIHQRTPRIWKTSKDKELSVKQTINEIDSMTEDVVAYDSLDIDDMSVVLAPAPFVTDKIDDHIEKLWADFYQLIGIANVQETKKERLIRDEMVAPHVCHDLNRVKMRLKKLMKNSAKIFPSIITTVNRIQRKETTKMWPMMFWSPMIPQMRKLANSYDEPPTVYALLNSYVNFANDTPVKIADLAKAGRAAFFDFEYPLTDKISREDFETMILNHFIMRRIGYETVTAFKIALNVKLNEIMPMYNKMFDSIWDWNLFADGETTTRDLTDDRTTSGDNTINTVNKTTGNSTSDQRVSDTPQNQIDDVKAGKYVSNYEFDTDTSNSENVMNSNNSNNVSDNDVIHETVKKSPSDKMKLYTEFLKNRQNVYTMIFKDLDVLFYQIAG